MNVVNLVVETVFWSCLALTLYAYLVYPACIWLLARWFSTAAEAAPCASEDLPKVTLIVAAHNEQAVIERKIHNSLELDYPRDRLSVVIASDGSSDATPEIASRFQDRGVRLLDYRQRRGKSGLLNSAIAATGGEILVLSDANTEFANFFEQGAGLTGRKLLDPLVCGSAGRRGVRPPAVASPGWRHEHGQHVLAL